MMQKSPLHIHVSVRNQELKLRRGRKIIRRFQVSTSRFGLGSEQGSNKTPLGQFRVSDKIGEAMPEGTIFVRSEEHTSELQSQSNLVCRLLLEKKKLRLR